MSVSVTYSLVKIGNSPNDRLHDVVDIAPLTNGGFIVAGEDPDSTTPDVDLRSCRVAFKSGTRRVGQRLLCQSALNGAPRSASKSDPFGDRVSRPVAA